MVGEEGTWPEDDLGPKKPQNIKKIDPNMAEAIQAKRHARLRTHKISGKTPAAATQIPETLVHPGIILKTEQLPISSAPDSGI